MNKIILKLLIGTIIIGIIAIAINTVFGSETITYLQKERLTLSNNYIWYMWKFDFWGYIKNIETTATNGSVLVFDLPTREWENVQNLSDLGNNIALLVDYLIMVINIILYPLRLGSYLLQNVLAILGVNTDTTNAKNGLSWLVIFVRDVLGNIIIPYI